VALAAPVEANQPWGQSASAHSQDNATNVVFEKKRGKGRPPPEGKKSGLIYSAAALRKAAAVKEKQQGATATPKQGALCFTGVEWSLMSYM
jgi:hypothetical protein